ncbi:MAG: FtsK/SpoIIIE domain-containing protein [Mobilicoccus sp.]|nr:FtsK/SpoIIIE domain-containing protein [Mobilicoccus sp.]
MASRGDDAVIMGVFFAIGVFFKVAWRLVTFGVHVAVWLARHPVMLATVVLGALVVGLANALPHGWWIVGAFVASIVGGTWVLGVRWPHNYERWVAHPIRCLWHGYIYRHDWQPVMVTSGLDNRLGGELVVPQILKVDARPEADHLRVLMPMGQVIEDWTAAIDQLRTSLCLTDVRVKNTDVPNQILVSFIRVDPLVAAVPPLVSEEPTLDALPVGRFEDGSTFHLGVRGTHLLIGGATSAGKSSVVWSIVAGLAPLTQTGVVQLWACDPKGGMELEIGRPLFHRFIHGSRGSSIEQETATALDELVELMQGRQDALRGKARMHEPTPQDPHIVFIIDELAALTAYSNDRDSLKRINAALRLLLSQGRAAGITIIGAVQDPRKETVPMRDLLPKRIGLRLTEPEQVDMLLGEGARRTGALCDKIPEGLPGVGYVKTQGVRKPQRVRFSYYSDEDIRALVDQYGAPAHELHAIEASLEDAA